jgi:hypothetical protein
MDWVFGRHRCLTRPDLFAPAVAQGGLSSSRVIYVECGDDKTVYALVLCGLHHRYMRMSGRTGSVMEEAGDCRPLASSRLQLILALDWNRKPISLQHLYIAKRTHAGFPRNS